jgi:hypothetical protein
MQHLTAEQLIDAIDGAHTPMADAHLQSCDVCRLQVAELRAVRDAAAAGGDVPEPSPLFWDHLSARVHEAVAAEGGARVAWWRPSAWPALMIPAAAALVIAFGLASVLTLRLTPNRVAPQQAPAEAIAATPPAADDASLNLVADLASQMDWESASQLGVALHAGAADEAIGDLSPAERRELERLLRELARPGA